MNMMLIFLIGMLIIIIALVVILHSALHVF